VNGHHEIVSINEKGSGFRRWLVYCFKNQYGYVPNSDALSQTMAGVQATAEYEGEKAKIHTRIAEKDGRVYLDLCNEQWQCIEISSDGWRVITCPPVYFRRNNGMLPLPLPQRGGSLDDLRALINAKTEKDYILITAWLIGALHPRGPYAALNLNGERGSAKSYTTKTLRNLIDPNEAPTRNAPNDEREAAITAQNNMVVALDNLSSIPLWFSDILCRTATGSGYSTRELYTDDEERIFSSKRPIIMNGIEDGIVTQGDLLNRTMLVTLEPPDTYIAEEDLDELFKELHPRILGTLLTAVVTALRDHRTVQLEEAPRMVDFAKWVTAAEPALQWEPGTFINAYLENQDNASSIIVESSPVAKAIVQFMGNHPDGWEGLVNELHDELNNYEVYKLAKSAPKAPSRLGGQLKRIAPSLRIQGIDIQQPPRTKKGSKVVISYTTGDNPPRSGNEKRCPVGVGKTQKGVGRTPSGVGKTQKGVGKICDTYTSEEPGVEPISSEKTVSGVGGVGSSASLSDNLSSDLVLKKEEKERNKERPDTQGILPTPLTSPDDEIEEFTL
jgi:hypothetical protein